MINIISKIRDALRKKLIPPSPDVEYLKKIGGRVSGKTVAGHEERIKALEKEVRALKVSTEEIIKKDYVKADNIPEAFAKYGAREIEDLLKNNDEQEEK
jgi:hypothetical protein